MSGMRDVLKMLKKDFKSNFEHNDDIRELPITQPAQSKGQNRSHGFRQNQN